MADVMRIICVVECGHALIVRAGFSTFPFHHYYQGQPGSSLGDALFEQNRVGIAEANLFQNRTKSVCRNSLAGLREVGAKWFERLPSYLGIRQTYSQVR